jgi:type IV pilus assembly protein PilO
MNLSLAKLPWYAQIGAFVALAVFGSGAFYYYYEMPAREDIASRELQLTGLKADITKGQNTAKKLPDFRAQVTDLEGRLSNLRAILPEEKEAEKLLRQLQTVAVQSNITIKNFKPGATVTKQLHVEWPISLELDGNYHNLATFFDRVGHFTQIVNISGLDIRGKDKPQVNSTITASCTATTFVLLDKQKPAPVKPGAPPAAKGN